MQRTQISLTAEERRLLDAEAARTGKSVAALIREAVDLVYRRAGDRDGDLSAIEESAGAWGDRADDGEAYVDALRSGRRLGTSA